MALHVAKAFAAAAHADSAEEASRWQSKLEPGPPGLPRLPCACHGHGPAGAVGPQRIGREPSVIDLLDMHTCYKLRGGTSYLRFSA